MNEICEKCATEGDFSNQEGLCDFCFNTKNNLGRGSPDISIGDQYEDLFSIDFV